MSSTNLKRNVFLFLPCQSFPPPLFLFYKSFSVYTGVRLMETSVPQSATLPLWKYTSMFSKSTCKNVIPYANECTSHPHFHFYFILFFFFFCKMSLELILLPEERELILILVYFHSLGLRTGENVFALHMKERGTEICRSKK